MCYEINQWRDRFSVTYPDIRKRRRATIGLKDYIIWVEDAHARNQSSGKLDDKWYKKRKGWILRLKEGKESKGRSNDSN